MPHSADWGTVSPSSDRNRQVTVNSEHKIPRHSLGDLKVEEERTGTKADSPKFMKNEFENLRTRDNFSGAAMDTNIAEMRENTQDSLEKCNSIQLVLRQHAPEEESAALIKNYSASKSNQASVSNTVLPKNLLRSLRILKRDGLESVPSSVGSSVKCQTQAGLRLCEEVRQADIRLPEWCWELLCGSRQESAIIQHSLNGFLSYWFSINTSNCYFELPSDQSRDEEHFSKKVVITPSKDFIVLHPMCAQNLGYALLQASEEIYQFLPSSCRKFFVSGKKKQSFWP